MEDLYDNEVWQMCLWVRAALHCRCKLCLDGLSGLIDDRMEALECGSRHGS